MADNDRFNVEVINLGGRTPEDVAEIATNVLLTSSYRRIVDVLSTGSFPVIIATNLLENTTLRLCSDLSDAGVEVDFRANQ